MSYNVLGIHEVSAKLNLSGAKRSCTPAVRGRGIH